MEVPIELCTSAKVYKPDPIRKWILLSLLVAIYSFSLPYCYYTAGEPRKAAMIQAQKFVDEKWSLEIHTTDTNATDVPNTIFFEPVIAENKVLNSLNTNDQVEEFDEFNNPKIVEEKTQVPNWLLSWFGESKEQKRSKAEFDRWEKEIKSKSGDSISLPPEYLPSAWACLALFLSLSLHALFHLMCHWVVAFKAFSYFTPATKVDEQCYVMITPPANRGQSALVPLKKSTLNGTITYFAEFQRQKYLYTPAAKLGENSRKYTNGVFMLAVYPTALPISHYLEARGITSDIEVTKLVEKWGKNNLSIAMPSFLEQLQMQLLSPLAIFQFFCAILWLLDEYWSYTFFTMLSVVGYEATTVFQRTRTQNMLGGMSPKPTPIYVYRSSKWSIITTKDLLPGDIISLAFRKRKSNTMGDAPPAATANNANKDNVVIEDNAKHNLTTKDDIIPCDCVLVRGSAVVNEASLTGESVPQMKEAIAYGETDVNSQEETKKEPHLDINGVHRVHTLFAGCSLVTVTGRKKGETKNTDDSVEELEGSSNIPLPPDGGAVAYVLRTGFGSSQGALLQMIEFSQQAVTGDIKETGMALSMLFFFALLASGYVLKEGLRKKEKTTHELLLRCIIIITSVVPRQFPMQMAVAVNMALMSLSKAGIFCTEQYRVPLAGKVSHCLFDKTGTITTDQLMPAGLINYNSSNNTAGEDNNVQTHTEEADIPKLHPVPSACGETALILAACHSLVVLDDDEDSNELTTANNFDPIAPKLPSSNLTGDPIELAAIKAIDWHWDGKSSTATPDGGLKRTQFGLQVAQKQYQKLASLVEGQRTPNHAKEIESVQKEMTILETKLREAKEKVREAMYSHVQVLQRHHFSSALQRMSVVAKCSNRPLNSDLQSSSSSTSSSSSDHWYCFVKGSPEALRNLILPSELPSWYNLTYEKLARSGLRVLALGYKRVSAKDRPQEQPRSWVETGLSFGGFIAFECKIRTDSKIVIKSLLQSDHCVAMLTGDALLTSLHVAKEVNICDKQKENLTLSIHKTDNTTYWNCIDHNLTSITSSSGIEKTLPFDMQQIPKLYQSYNLLTTEDILLQVIKSTGDKTSLMWQYTQYFKVFARMSPQGKANIIKSIQDTNPDHHVFMCGDGGNDVGALKQADIGLALLAGHANANTSEDIEATTSNNAAIKDGKATSTTTTSEEDKKAEDILNEHQKKLAGRNDALNKARMAHMKEFQARYQQEQQAILQEQIRIRTEAGDYMAMFTLVKEQAIKSKQALAAENARFMAMHGQVWDPKSDADSGASSRTAIEQLMESMDSTDGSLPVVRPGDASVAAPFTSRIPSIRAVVDLIRQGRCTLLSALMQQQIMMLESTISAYTLSALSLHNARSSERQMMASSWLIVTAAISFSYAAPVDHMHPLRPLRSLFHPAIICSILGQALIHILCMSLAVQWATDAMGPETLKEVTEFFKKVKANEIDRTAHCTEGDFMCEFQSYWMAPFMPNLLNSVVFLVETSQMIAVFFTNYKGRPWMKGMLENHPLFLSVFICILGVIVAAWELIPQANDLIQLTPFPSDEFRYRVLFLVIATIMGTFAWDRLCIYLFAPKVFQATMEEFKKTTIQDFLPIFMTVLKVVGVLFILSTGNILLGILAFYWYRNYYNKPQA